MELILRKLSEAVTEEELRDAYPRLTRADIQAAIGYAADSVGKTKSLKQHVLDMPNVGRDEDFARRKDKSRSHLRDPGTDSEFDVQNSERVPRFPA